MTLTNHNSQSNKIIQNLDFIQIIELVMVVVMMAVTKRLVMVKVVMVVMLMVVMVIVVMVVMLMSDGKPLASLLVSLAASSTH